MNDYAFIADAQGFTFNGNFVPRELSVKTREGEIHHEFYISSSNKTEIDLSTAAMTKKTIHGLSVETPRLSNALPSCLFKFILTSLYERLSSFLGQKVVVHNPQLAKIFREIHIPVVELTISRKWEPKCEPACSLHDFPGAQCSRSKVRRIALFLNS